MLGTQGFWSTPHSWSAQALRTLGPIPPEPFPPMWRFSRSFIYQGGGWECVGGWGGRTDGDITGSSGRWWGMSFDQSPMCAPQFISPMSQIKHTWCSIPLLLSQETTPLPYIYMRVPCLEFMTEFISWNMLWNLRSVSQGLYPGK